MMQSARLEMKLEEELEEMKVSEFPDPITNFDIHSWKEELLVVAKSKSWMTMNLYSLYSTVVLHPWEYVDYGFISVPPLQRFLVCPHIPFIFDKTWTIYT